MGRLIERFARALYAGRLVLWAVVAAACLGFVGLLVFPRGGDGDDLLLGAVCVALLGLSLLGLGYAFRVPLPEHDPGAPLLERLGLRLRRTARWLLAMVMLVLLALAALFTMRAVGIMV